MIYNKYNKKGLTLIELLVTLAIIGILLSLGGPELYNWYSRSKLENQALQLYGDIRWAESIAMEQGEVGINIVNDPTNPAVINANTLKRRVFVALDPGAGTYRIFRWQDENSNGVYDSGEFDPDFKNTSDNPIKSRTSIHFGRNGLIDDAACSGNETGSNQPIVNINPCPAGSVFDDTEYCLRFNAKGFNEGLANAAIYISNDNYSYAIRINLTGTVELCELVERDLDEDGDKWDWKRIK